MLQTKSMGVGAELEICYHQGYGQDRLSAREPGSGPALFSLPPAKGAKQSDLHVAHRFAKNFRDVGV